MPTVILDQRLAFPTARGFGRNTTGGRGGQIIKVTTLNDSGAGSFREAVMTPGPRIIVFDVGGDIFLTTSIRPAEGDLTIAGETAPSPGITLRGRDLNGSQYGGVFDMSRDNMIMRFVTIRDFNDALVATDSFRTRNDTGGGNNIILDHMSMSHGDDETYSVVRYNNTTIQYSLMTSPRSVGSYLTGPNVFNHSSIGNYLAQSSRRNPIVGYGSSSETSEWINNIVYGYISGMTLVWGNVADVLGNVYKAFANFDPGSDAIKWDYNQYNNPTGQITDGRFYLADNFLINPHGHNVYNQRALDHRSSSRVITNSYETSWFNNEADIVSNILPHVGNSLHRDVLDQAMVDSYAAETGDFNDKAITDKVSASKTPGYDSIITGMDDTFVQAHNISSPNEVISGWDFGDYLVQNNAGYNAIEIYLAYTAGDFERLEQVDTVKPNLTLDTKYAFPGAEGFGRIAVGGRGGDVYHVVNLNDSGTGSLRYGLLRQDGYTGPRTIVFDVGGDITMSNVDINAGLNVPPNATANASTFGYITIAGQTAPSPGIALKENGIRFYCSDVIMRYFTIRSSDNGAADNANSPGALTFRNYSLGFTMQRIMLDHLTLSHGGNENLVLGADDPNNPMLNTTVSNCMIGPTQGDGTALLFYNLPNTSVIRNYFHHSKRRNPLISGALAQFLDFPIEYINNVNYGGDGGVSGDRSVKLDVLYNIYKSTANMQTVYYPFGITENQKNNLPPGFGEWYFQGNVVESIVRDPNGNTGDYSPETLPYNANSRVVANSIYSNYLTDIEEIKASVFETVGNSLYRDAYDQEKIDDYGQGTGDYDISVKPSKQASQRPANFYSTLADIPEDFVQAHNISLRDQVIQNWDFGTYTVTNTAGYTAFEMYLAWVAGDLDRLAGKLSSTVVPTVPEPVTNRYRKMSNSVTMII